MFNYIILYYLLY